MLRDRSLWVLALLVVACGSDDEEAAAGPANNSAILSGATIGTGATPVNELRKILPVQVSLGDGFEVGQAYVTRRHPMDALIALAVPVKNTTSARRCSVRGGSVAWRNASGSTLAEVDASVWGSVGQNGTTFSGSCLEPNQTGYLLGSNNTADLFANVASIALSVTSDGQAWTWPAARVVPTSYQVVPGSDGQDLRVNFQNTGTAAAIVAGGSHHYLLLDGSGLPMSSGLLLSGITPAGGSLGPGQSGSAGDTQVDLFAGQVSRVLAMIDFDQG